jgi:hypothetical protein
MLATANVKLWQIYVGTQSNSFGSDQLNSGVKCIDIKILETYFELGLPLKE